MQYVPKERFFTPARPRHARLFELIRQDYRRPAAPCAETQGSAEENTADFVIAAEAFRALACKSLRY
jgi:hypothetical protein